MEIIVEYTGTIQDILIIMTFTSLMQKLKKLRRGLGLDDIGLDSDVTELKWRTTNESIAR